MSSIDERVVQMKFENSDFNNKAKSTLDSLRSLKDNLKLDGASQGLAEAGRGIGSFQGHLAGVAQSFTALQAIAFGALASIGAKAVETAQQMATALTISPVSSGLHEYETNIKSIQTILANTKASGATLDDVNRTLEELNTYSDETIYNFSQMANAIGLFTANGVDLERSASSIKGIANLSALSGSSAEQAAGLYRQLSQAIASGKVSLMDWTSVITAGVGGTVFQRALAQTAVAMGELDAGALKLEGSMQNVKINGESFRDSISAEGGGSSWLTSDVLVNTLRTFSGDMNAAELAAMGFKQAQIDAIIEQGKAAKAAAQDVKTLSQAFDIAKEVAGSGWAYTWQLIMGDFEEAKKTFTEFSNWLNSFIEKSSDARNEMVRDWKMLGGRDALIEGFKNAGKALLGILIPIKDAFRGIFPATTARDLYLATHAFKDFMAALIPGERTAENIQRTFSGFFAIFGIGWEFIKAAASFLLDMFGIIAEGSGGILEFTGNIGDFLTTLHSAIKQGDIFGKMFDRIGDVLEPVIRFIKDLIGAIGGFFGGGGFGDASEVLEDFNAVGENLSDVARDAQAAWEALMRYFQRIGENLRPVGEGIMEFFRDAIDAVTGFLQGLSFEDVLAGVGVGAFATIAVAVRKFFQNFSLESLLGSGDEDGWISRIADAMEQLTESLQAMQNALNATALLGIAIAIGLLTLAVIGLAGIPHDDLVSSLMAIGLLVGIITAIAKFMSNMEITNTGNLIVVAIAMILLAGAVKLLASAVKDLEDSDPAGLARGLASVVSLLVIVGGGARFLKAGDTQGLITAGISLILLAVAINILVNAVEDFSALDWNELAKGLVGVVTLITALGLFARFSRASSMGIRSGVGIILLATAILILAEAVEKIQELDWHQLARGIAGFAAALAIMVFAIRKLPPVSLGDGITLVLMATSMVIVGEALEKVAELDWENWAKSLVGMGIVLALFTAALRFIPEGAVFSGVALIAAATAMVIIGYALEKLGQMSWSDIAAALVQLTVVMGIIGLFMAFAATGLGAAAMLALGVSLILIAGAILVLSFALERLGAMSWSDIGAAIGGLTLLFVVLALGGVLSPLILALGVALTVLAGALLIAAGAIYIAGAGLESFASAIERLSQIDAAGVDNVVNSLTSLLELIPVLAEQAALGLVEFVTTLGENAGVMSEAFGDIMAAMIERIATDTPLVVEAFGEMMVKTLTSLSEYVPRMVTAAADLIVGLLNGIAQNMGRIVTAGTNAVVAFMRGLSSNTPRLVDEGMKMMIKFMTSLEISIRNDSARLVAAAKGIGSALIAGITEGLWGGSSQVSTAARGVASTALSSARNALGIKSPSKKFMEIGEYATQGFVKGLQGNRDQIDKSVNDMFGKLNDIMHDAKNRAESAQRSLERLTSARKKDYAEINRQRQILAEANSEYARAANAHHVLANNLSWHHNELRRLAAQSDSTAEKLKEANKKLEDAKKTRDDYMESVRNDYNDLPEFTAKTNLTKYISDFEKQIVDTQNFASAVQELRKRGLNDTMYKELIAKGPEAMPFVQQLLNQGKEGVGKLNTLGIALDKAATTLGTDAARSLYQAGVNAAQGLVDGLKKQDAAIDKQMAHIANLMVRNIKAQLGIRSPSKVFEEIGRQTTEGLAIGLRNSAAVEKSAEDVGKKAISTMQKTLAGLGEAIASEVELHPTISPVLDLNAVRKDASLLNSMLAVKPIDIQDQAARAKDAAAGLRENQLALEELAMAGSGDHISFTQNNYSPKALSSAEVYRQTNNQLSRAKGALAT